MGLSATAQLLDLLIDRAPKLREAGVLRVQLEGLLSFELAPVAPEIDDGEDRQPENYEHSDPLQDPATFPGGHVPGFRRRPHEEHHR